jgi:hypothetical protein
VAVVLLLVYGVATLTVGALFFTQRPTVQQTIEGVLVALIGLLAIAGGVVWLQVRRRARR